jgi:hypothetical protein
MLKTLDKWHKTRLGLLIFGLVELAIAYGFASLAIDRGNAIWYLLLLVFLVGALQNFLNLLKKVIHGS